MMGLGLGLTTVAVQRGAAAIVLVQDTFTRADNAATLGSTEIGALTWQYSAGSTFGIVGNTAAQISAGTGTGNVAFVISSVSDGTVSDTFAVVGDTPRLVFRYVDPANYLMWQRSNANGMSIYKYEAGAFTELGSAVVAVVDGDVLSVALLADSITGLHNGVAKTTVSSAFQQTAVRHGIASNANTTRHDNFRITVP